MKSFTSYIVTVLKIGHIMNGVVSETRTKTFTSVKRIFLENINILEI